MTTTTRSLGDLLADRSLAVVAGSGGVGKTTVSAALGLAATQHLEGDVLVLTIDPARRLAAALGIDISGNDAVRVPGSGTSTSRLFAAMLDPGPAWDSMVVSQAAPDDAARILANPVYRRIADTFVHGNDYAALAWLDEAIASDEYRLIIVDTPPSQNALDFFDAPARVSEFFGSSLLVWLTGGDGSFVGGAAAKSFASLADRLLGAEFFADVVEFFQLMNKVVPGMVDRTSTVAADLAGDDAAFIAVTAPSDDVVLKLEGLAESLATRDLTFDGLVVNGVEPEVFWNPKVHDVAERVLANRKSPISASGTSLLGPGAEYVVERCEVANEQRRVLAKLPASTVTTIPRLVHSPTDVEGLQAIGELLWLGA
ncbi:MAG: anion-transporting ArsA/GET3 family ATPase [Verrucomicrobiales bacterium]